MIDNRSKISVLIPVFNEEPNLPLLVNELTQVLEELPYEFDILFVNDGSNDLSFPVLVSIANENKKIKLIDLSRNFGKEVAISCGLEHIDGEAVIIMDADLQHPPSAIPTMLEKWNEGFDMVVPINEKRTHQSIVLKSLSKSFYRLMSFLSTVDMPQNGSDFRLIDKKVVKVICELRESRRFMKAMYAWPGYKVSTFPYSVRDRHASQSSWNIWKLWNFALEGLFNFSSVPLQIWTYIGFIIAVISATWGFTIGVRALIYGIEVVEGVTTVAVFLFFTIALVMIQGGILGEYVARIFDEVKNRPLYVVRKKVNFDSSNLPNERGESP